MLMMIVSFSLLVTTMLTLVARRTAASGRRGLATLADKLSASDRPAVVHPHEHSKAFSYAALREDSRRIAEGLLNLQQSRHVAAHQHTGSAHDLHEQRVGMLFPPNYDYVASMVGVFRAGGVAVPLSPEHVAADLQYYVKVCLCVRVLRGRELFN